MDYNCSILGDKQTGKTTFSNYWSTNNFTLENSEDVNCIRFKNTNFNLCENFIPDLVHCAIIMFNISNKVSFDNVINHYNSLNLIVPTIICGIKIQQHEEVTENHLIQFLHYTYKHLNFKYYEINNKTLYNIEKPFQCLINTLNN